MGNHIIVSKVSCQWCSVSFYSRHQKERDSDHKTIFQVWDNDLVYECIKYLYAYIYIFFHMQNFVVV